jgi:cell division protein FtsW (lipid II flippase)
MHFKLQSTYDFYILFIVLVKIVFILSAIGLLVISHTDLDSSKQLEPKLQYWKEHMEFIFTIATSILLIYHFKPGKNKPVSEETSLLFFLFGWILIFTAKWNIFIKESPWYKQIFS